MPRLRDMQQHFRFGLIFTGLFVLIIVIGAAVRYMA